MNWLKLNLFLLFFHIRANFINKSETEFMDKTLFANVSQPRSKQAIITAAYLTILKERLGNDFELKFLDQMFFTTHTGLAMKEYFYLKHELDKHVVHCIENGLFGFWRHHSMKEPIPTDPPGPEVLTMSHLSIGFEIFAICLIVSTLVFTFELIWFKVSRTLCRCVTK